MCQEPGYTEHMRLTFGKYRGHDINDIYQRDRKYLVWVATNNFTTAKSCLNKQIEYIKALVEEDIKEEMVKEQLLKQQRKVVYDPIVGIFGGSCMKTAIKKSREISEWCQSIINSLRAGDKLSLRAQEIITDMCGKGSGRRNSRSYNETFDTVHNAFQLANNIDQHN